MIKLYLLYLPLGAYVLLRSFETWFCSHYNDCNDVITWLSMISSGILFLVIPGFLQYKEKTAAIAGLVCLTGILPFAIYWLNYIYKYEGFMRNTENKTILTAAVVYAIAIFFTVKYVAIPYPPVRLKKSIKLILCLLPTILLIAALFVNSNS